MTIRAPMLVQTDQRPFHASTPRDDDHERREILNDLAARLESLPPDDRRWLLARFVERDDLR